MNTGGITILSSGGISTSMADKRYVMREDSVYGVRWDYVNDVMQPGVLIGGLFVPADYETFPLQEKMARCLRTSAGAVTMLHPDDSHYLTDGTTLAALDGSDGQIMTQIERHYALDLKDGDYRYSFVSPSRFGFKSQAAYIPPIFGSDQYRYIGSFHGVADSDAVSATLRSIIKDCSGYSSNAYPNPFSNRTRAQFRAQMESGFFPYCWGLYETLFRFFLTEYKTWNSQSVLPGYTDASGWGYARTRPAGRTLGLGNASGSILVDLVGTDADLDGIVSADEYVANSYRGVENPFGNVWQFIDGINIDNTDGDCHVYVCHDPAAFADNTPDNYIDTGHSPGFGGTNNYIKDMAFLGQTLTFYPAEIGGGSSSATYITDFHYNSAGGWRVLRAGGLLSNGADAGLGDLYASAASSYSGSSISARSAA